MVLDRNYYRYPNRLAEWCQTRIRSQQGYDLIRQLFAYDPDKRLTAKEALAHKWFQEDLRPTRKYVTYGLFSWSLLVIANNNVAYFFLFPPTTCRPNGESLKMRHHP
jgi:cyclin-dependent kinase 8/11